MAVFSSNTLVSSSSIFNLLCAYFLVVNPSAITGHNAVVLMSNAVNLPIPVPSRAGDDFVALLAAVLALFGVADLSALSLRDEVSSSYWLSQAPVRLLFFFAMTAYSYSLRPGGLLATRADSVAAAMAGKGSVGGLGSGLVFSWAFFGMIIWFWIFVTLRDERRDRPQKRE